jgi:pseudouridine-5'-monophosphatase
MACFLIPKEWFFSILTPFSIQKFPGDSCLIFSEILARYGKIYDWNLKAQLMGKREMDAAEFLVKSVDLPISAQEYLDERNKMHASLFPLCRPLPGVLKLVRHLKKHNIPIAVCTSSHFAGYKLKTSQ